MKMPKNMDKKAALMGGTIILGLIAMAVSFLNDSLEDKKMELAVEEEVEKQLNVRLGEPSKVEEEG